MAPSREIEKLQRRWQENSLGLTFAPLAEAYRKEGLYADALELLTIGLAQHPNYVPAHIVRGRCLVDTFQDGAAEESFQKVLDLDPENVIALKGLADLAERGGRLRDARSRLHRLLEFDRNNEEARFQLDRIHAVIGDDPPPPPAAAAEMPGAESFVAVVDVPAPPEIPASDPEVSADETADGEIPRAAIVDFDEAEVVLYQPLDLSASTIDDRLTDLPDRPAPFGADSRAGNGVETEPAAEEPAADPAADGEVAVEGFHSWDPPEAPAAPALVATAGEPIDPADPLAEFATADEPTDPADPLAEFATAGGSIGMDFPGAMAAAEPEAAQPAPTAETAGTPADGVTPEPVVTPHVSEPAIASPTSAAAEVESPSIPFDGQPAELESEIEIEVEVTAEPDPTPRDEDAEAVAGFEADPELVVTETMAEIFLRQGHRELALAVYAQLATREPDNERIAAAIDQLQHELRPDSASALPAFAAVLTGGLSVRSFFERLLSASRPGVAPAAPPGPSLGAVFGEGSAPAAGAAGAAEAGPSYDEFYGDDTAAPDDVPAAAAAADDSTADDLEGFTSWLKGLKR